MIKPLEILGLALFVAAISVFFFSWWVVVPILLGGAGLALISYAEQKPKK